MRFNFDLDEAKSDPTRSATPKDEVEWVPLQNHPAFTSTTGPAHHHHSTESPPLRNLLAWDGASRLYFWNSDDLCLHRISIRLGEPDPTSVFAASLSKVLQPDVKLNFTVTKISVNSNGSAILLYGTDGLFIIYLYGRTSSRDGATICRTVTVGAEIYSSGNNVIRILQVSWHPNSDTHLGILSSDSVFRLFHLSLDLIQPEQAYFLQPVQPGTSRNATSICPVDFSFGGDHLWDCFSVFFLFSDGSIYILCPIIPFGSVHKWESIVDIYNDAQTFGLKSPNPTAVSHSNLAISWLEATFPEITGHSTDEADLSVIRARPYALFDASLSLQGPLRKVSRGEDEADLAFRGAECEGRAVSFLYNLVSKDSILITAWSGGQLQIDALADEIQPVWNIDSPPRLCVDSQDNIRALAMICVSTPDKLSTVKLDQPLDSTLWLGHPPPLLRLAIVDLALPKKTGSSSHVMMFIDPLMLERIYTLHDGGIDSIVLHYLPFTSQTSGMNETMRTPSVHPVLSTCQGEYSSHSPLSGFVSLSDSFGYSWIVAVTASQECIVLEMKTLNLLLPHHVDTEKKSVLLEESKDKDTSDIIISKELLGGPKVVLVPQTSPNMRSVSVDSIEGRSMLNEYFKLFHENYVEYAHKVYFELKHQGPHLKRIIDDQHDRLGGAKQRLMQVEKKYSDLENRINDAVQMQNHLEEHLKRLRSVPGVHKKPLSRAEREFKSELGKKKKAKETVIAYDHEDGDSNDGPRLNRRSQCQAARSQRQPAGDEFSATSPTLEQVEDSEVSGDELIMHAGRDKGKKTHTVASLESSADTVYQEEEPVIPKTPGTGPSNAVEEEARFREKDARQVVEQVYQEPFQKLVFVATNATVGDMPSATADENGEASREKPEAHGGAGIPVVNVQQTAPSDVELQEATPQPQVETPGTAGAVPITANEGGDVQTQVLDDPSVILASETGHVNPTVNASVVSPPHIDASLYDVQTPPHLDQVFPQTQPATLELSLTEGRQMLDDLGNAIRSCTNSAAPQSAIPILKALPASSAKDEALAQTLQDAARIYEKMALAEKEPPEVQVAIAFLCDLWDLNLENEQVRESLVANIAVARRAKSGVDHATFDKMDKYLSELPLLKNCIVAAAQEKDKAVSNRRDINRKWRQDLEKITALGKSYEQEWVAIVEKRAEIVKLQAELHQQEEAYFGKKETVITLLNAGDAMSNNVQQIRAAAVNAERAWSAANVQYLNTKTALKDLGSYVVKY